jgi:hypothetical protein
MAAKKTTKPKRASGPTQPEAERRNPQFKLRLSPEIADDMRARSAASGVPVSRLVEIAWEIAVASGRLDA